LEFNGTIIPSPGPSLDIVAISVARERTRMSEPWDEIKAWMQSWNKPNELLMPNLPQSIKLSAE